MMDCRISSGLFIPFKKREFSYPEEPERPFSHSSLPAKLKTDLPQYFTGFAPFLVCHYEKRVPVIDLRKRPEH